MLNQQASRTALGTAYLRAAHQILDASPLILADPVALKLLGENAEKEILDAPERYKTSTALELRSHVVLRSRFAEDRLLAAVNNGASQYVLVGAGFDTFALRQPAWASAIKIIEVDHPDTQQLKRDFIARAGLSLPANIIFADIDFEHESLYDGLRRHNVPLGVHTFFSWLGVTMYLTDGAIDSTLDGMVRYAKTSEVVITFLQRPVSGSEVDSPLAKHVAAMGEPFVSYFTPAAFKEKLLRAGFNNVDFLSHQSAAAAYFQNRESGLPIPKRISIAYARR